MSIKAAEALANDRARVARHPFYPFLQFERHWTRYAEKGKKGQPKTRKISYACRADCYIFAKYREELSVPYEQDLVSFGLAGNVIAYRRLVDETSSGGKCNIDFAKDVFEKVKHFGNCYALTLDISAYFDSIDHEKLKGMWCRMLGVERLPDDHFKVFRAVTKFSSIKAQAAYARLGHFGPKYVGPSGAIINGYLTPAKDMPKQLCTGRKFRELIAGGNKEPSLVIANEQEYGIPQGSTISDLLANMYLLDFDVEIKAAAHALGGHYFRYSDDIIVIAPCSEEDISNFAACVSDTISAYGSQLIIKPSKSTLHKFTGEASHQACQELLGNSAANGLEYLGFRFDGKFVYIRNSTLSNCRRKIVKAAYFKARGHYANHQRRTPKEMVELINYPDFVQRYGRVEDFYNIGYDYKQWTFWTYAKRAARTFGPDGVRILRQLRGYRRFCRRLLKEAVEEEIRHPTRRYPRVPVKAPPGTPLT